MQASGQPWQNPRILSTLLVVFLAGGAVGALVMQLGLHDKLHRTVSASTRQPTPQVVAQRFRTQLNLTSEQTNQIALVLEDFGQYYQSLQDQFEDIRATGKNRITQILNPEQRAKFEQMVNELAPQLQKSK